MEAIKVSWNLEDDSILQKCDFESSSVSLAARLLDASAASKGAAET